MTAFKNITTLAFSPDVSMDVELQLTEELLHENQLRPVGLKETKTIGFVPLVDGEFAVRLGAGAVLIGIGTEERVLPPASIAYKLSKKIKAIELDEGRKVGGRERRRLKDDIVMEMLPSAPIKPKMCRAILDFDKHRIYIDTAAKKPAEIATGLLRVALGSFPAVPLGLGEDAMAPWSTMTSWLTGSCPEKLFLGSDCELRDKTTSNGAKWRGKNVDLDSEEVAEHLRNGMQASRLGLLFHSREQVESTFELGDDLVVRKFRFDSEYFADQISEDDEVEYRTTMLVFVEHIRKLTNYLADEMGLVQPE